MISRRLFLVGSSAFVAATALPRGVGEPAYMRTSSIFDYRKIHKLMFSLDLTREESDSDVQVCSLKIHNAQSYDPEKPLLNVVMNPRGTYFWSAMPGYELLVEHERGVMFDVQPAFGIARLGLTYNVVRDPKERPRLFNEQMLWSKGKLTTYDPFALDHRDKLPKPKRGWEALMNGTIVDQPETTPPLRTAR